MAGEKCKINLYSTQKMGGEQEQIMDQYQGSFIERENRRYLSYTRHSEDGEIDCLISFDRRSISMTQKGALRSKLELMPGKQTNNEYNTPFGLITLQVFTRRYEMIEQKNSFKLIIDYDIITGPDPIQTQMEIVVQF